MSGPIATTLLPSVSQSSNLLQYRALFQVFTYARVKRQSAEQLIRDAVMGGVVVPFSFAQNEERVVTHSDAVSAQSSGQNACTHSPPPQQHTHLQRQQQPFPESTPETGAPTNEVGHSHVLFLPSSKCIGTLATLLADGFFNVAPLSSTAEKVHGTPFQHQSECEARDYFTLIALLYPDCFVEGVLPCILLAPQRAASTSAPQRGMEKSLSPTRALSLSNSSQTSVTALRNWKSPQPQDVLLSKSCEEEIIAASEAAFSPHTAGHQTSFLVEPRTYLPSVQLGLQSPAKSTVSEQMLNGAQGQSFSVTGITSTTAALTATTMAPEVDLVPLTAEGVDDLLQCRRSLAAVLLSSLNEALHDVQYRELERTRPVSKGTTSVRSASGAGEAAALQLTSEILLTAKMLLMCVMAASEVWRRQVFSARQQASLTDNNLIRITPPLPSPHRVLYDLLDHDETTATQFTALPVEEWGWGKDNDATGHWYDLMLDRLVQSTEAAGVKLDSFLQWSKTVATQQGEAVSRTPTLLLHRPSDGRPAVEFDLSFMGFLNTAVTLPVMPLQVGEVQLLLHPCAMRREMTLTKKASEIYASRGHELLFDCIASPTADFLQMCVSAPCPPVMLQGTGNGMPALFQHRLQELSASEQAMIKAHLRDPLLLGAFVEKNAPMLARLTLWCDWQWPPEKVTLPNAISEGEGKESVTPTLVTNEIGCDMASEIRESVMFRRPFSAAIGRYVREMVLLNGFDQVTLERWIRHICSDLAHNGAFAVHRAALAALVKFAALQSKWTWTSEVAELQKQYLP